MHRDGALARFWYAAAPSRSWLAREVAALRRVVAASAIQWFRDGGSSTSPRGSSRTLDRTCAGLALTSVRPAPRAHRSRGATSPCRRLAAAGLRRSSRRRERHPISLSAYRFTADCRRAWRGWRGTRPAAAMRCSRCSLRHHRSQWKCAFAALRRAVLVGRKARPRCASSDALSPDDC